MSTNWVIVEENHIQRIFKGCVTKINEVSENGLKENPRQPGHA
jgi:hypothetical protein